MDNIFFVDKNPSASTDQDDHQKKYRSINSNEKSSRKRGRSTINLTEREIQSQNLDDEKMLAALEEEKQLESLIFDDPEEALENMTQDNNQQDFPSSFSNAVLNRLESTKSKRNKEVVQLQPVWVDDQDAELTVDLSNSSKKKLKRSVDETKIDVKEYESRLRALKEKSVYQSLDWAQITDTKSNNGTDLLQKNKSFIDKSTALQPHQLGFVKTVDANAENPFSSRIQFVNFHPSSQLLLVASHKESQFRLFHVDGTKNSQVQSVSIQKFKISKAVFSPNGKEVVAISEYSPLCYIYDIQADSVYSIQACQKQHDKPVDIQFSPDNELIAVISSSGQLDLVADNTKRKFHTFKASGHIIACNFTADSKHIYCASDDRNIYVFDTQSRRCVHRFVDEGASLVSCLAFSPDGLLLAVGSNSGIVNVYETKSIEGKTDPAPVHTVMNLKTTISGLKFNSTSEILAIHTSQVANGIRLIHTPSWTTFQNWPPQSKASFTCFDISPDSAYVSLGTSFGKVFMYKLLHFATSV